MMTLLGIDIAAVWGTPWVYTAACVVLPVVWGLGIVWVTTRLERAVRRRGDHGDPSGSSTPPPLEFHI